MTHPVNSRGDDNQPPSFEDVNLYASDVTLQEAVAREGGGAAQKGLHAFGIVAGSAGAQERGRLANEHTPRLRTHDRHGRRLDVVEYHPAYHALMETSFAEGLHCSPYLHLLEGAGARSRSTHVERAGAFYMAAQMEAGHCCPVTLTHAAIPVLARVPAFARDWLPRILTRTYDPAFEPIAGKASVTIGMGMTEKQGGTDVRANTTRAVPAGGGDGHYILTGHKWFLSAPMSDAFLVLAQAPGGLSCFLVPRFLPDGSVNGLRLLRLKDKLGNRSNASAEVELEGAHGWLAGEEGRGVATIIDMVTATRLDCALASAGLMRFAMANAIHHAEHRRVSGKALIDQPLMREVLADLALDVEAATALSFRLARAFDHQTDERAAAWVRLMTPVTKYWVCKIASAVAAEAMECLGGNGYAEDWPLARLYREVPVNGIWEGSGNVMALDVLRVLQKEPLIVETVMDDLELAAGDDPHLKAAHTRVAAILHEPRLLDARGRMLTEGLALLAAGTILRGHVMQPVADAFIATRLGALARQSYGVGLDWADTKAILARATPNRG